MIKYVVESPADTFLTGTEAGILYQIKEFSPDKRLIPIPTEEDNTCACSECVFMKVNTKQKVLDCLQSESHEIILDPMIQYLASIPIQRMLQLS